MSFRSQYVRIPEPKTSVLDQAYFRGACMTAKDQVNSFFSSEDCRRMKLRELLEDRKRVVLDIGCGSGDFTYYLAALVDPNLTIGIDVMPEAIRLARTRYPTRLSNLSYQVGDVYDLPFEDSAGLVALRMALHNFNDLPGALQEIRKTMVDGGAIRIKDINPEVILDKPSLREYYLERLQMSDREWLEKWAVNGSNDHDKLFTLSYVVSVFAAYTKEELMEAFLDAGFESDIHVSEHDDRILVGVAKKL